VAGRTLNRRDLRKQAELAEQAQPQTAPPDGPTEAGEPVKKARKAAARKPTTRKPRAPKPEPRLRARWCIYDGGMKQVALFPYNQRAAADAKLAELQGRAKGVHFLRLFKDALPQPPAAVRPGE
jgi:hypothetical protein